MEAQAFTQLCQAYQDRRDAICEAFDEVGWHIDKSPATMFVWARIPDQYEDSYAFTKDLMEKTGVVLLHLARLLAFMVLDMCV